MKANIASQNPLGLDNKWMLSNIPAWVIFSFYESITFTKLIVLIGKQFKWSMQSLPAAAAIHSRLKDKNPLLPVF